MGRGGGRNRNLRLSARRKSVKLKLKRVRKIKNEKNKGQISDININAAEHETNFPKNDNLQKWLDVVPPKGKIGKYSHICSEHFNETDFRFTGSQYRRVLKKSAVPSKFVYCDCDCNVKLHIHQDIQNNAASTSSKQGIKRGIEDNGTSTVSKQRRLNDDMKFEEVYVTETHEEQVHIKHEVNNLPDPIQESAKPVCAADNTQPNYQLTYTNTLQNINHNNAHTVFIKQECIEIVKEELEDTNSYNTKEELQNMNSIYIKEECVVKEELEDTNSNNISDVYNT